MPVMFLLSVTLFKLSLVLMDEAAALEACARDLESRSEAEGDGTIDETINDTTTISTTDAANTQQVIVYESAQQTLYSMQLSTANDFKLQHLRFTTTSTSTNHSNNSCQQQQKR